MDESLVCIEAGFFSDFWLKHNIDAARSLWAFHVQF